VLYVVCAQGVLSSANVSRCVLQRLHCMHTAAAFETATTSARPAATTTIDSTVTLTVRYNYLCYCRHPGCDIHLDSGSDDEDSAEDNSDDNANDSDNDNGDNSDDDAADSDDSTVKKPKPKGDSPTY
jgi:hypothetical protein